MLEVLFACVVAVAMPVRAWRRHLRNAPPRAAGSYVAETLLLTGALAALLWRHRVPLQALGLQPASPLRLLFDSAVCLAVIVGPDAWSTWRITQTAGEAAALPPPAGLAADALAARPAPASYVVTTVVGAIWEELCFRGTVFLLVPRTPGWLVAGVVGGSLLFGSQHLRGGLTGMAYSSFFGVLFSILYLVTGDLIAVVVAHAAGNILTATCWAPRIERARQAARRGRQMTFIG